MARIRTIKPEFFTSEDIVGLSPMARLLYIAVWCEADKEGRLVWKPVTFKLRYFPGDNCDIQSMCQELVDAGLVVLYGAGYAHIPTFAAHQHINPRESASQLPVPDEKPTRQPRVGTRRARVSTGANPDVHAQVGREGKGKEGNERGEVDPRPDPSPSAPAPTRLGTRLSADWTLPEDWRQWCVENRPDLSPEVTADRFRDFWVAKPGKDGRKADWQATWRNWCRGEKPGQQATQSPIPKHFAGAI